MKVSMGTCPINRGCSRSPLIIEESSVEKSNCEASYLFKLVGALRQVVNPWEGYITFLSRNLNLPWKINEMYEICRGAWIMWLNQLSPFLLNHSLVKSITLR